MTRLAIGARMLLGFIFLVFGLNGFFNFLRLPPMAPQAGNFLTALVAAHYMLPLIKITEIACGALLFFRRAVPLALVVLSPIVLNIFCFHLFLDRRGLIYAVPIAGLHVFVALANWRSFTPLFSRGI